MTPDHAIAIAEGLRLMRKNNPAVYECKSKKSRAGMHHWVRTDTGTAYCKNEGCGVELNLEDAADCFYDTERH